MRNITKFLLRRTTVCVILITFQLAAFIGALFMIGRQVYFIYPALTALGFAVALWVAVRDEYAAYKLAWVIPILMLPIFGAVLYLIFGGGRDRRAWRIRASRLNNLSDSLPADEEARELLKAESMPAFRQSEYMRIAAYFPVYRNTGAHYLTPGERKFGVLLRELETASKFIFLEYFIISEGGIWDKILAILTEKAKNGVEVRVLYDGMGSADRLPKNYPETLRGLGIKCRVFNPLTPGLFPEINNRDHRKLFIIDGHTGFTGGVNLSDEYVSVHDRSRLWKDSAILIKGGAVWSMTVLFLQMWASPSDPPEDLNSLRPADGGKEGRTADSAGFVQPFGDIPIDAENVSEQVYLGLISRANRYIYIQTPYLILNDTLMSMLCASAKSGVDVRIMTPHMGDRWFVHAATRSNYPALLKSGARIYEYAPGFLHSKAVVSDDEQAVVGTVNFDYRSLYLSYECGVWLYRTEAVLEIRDDFLKTLDECVEVTAQDYAGIPFYKRAFMRFLRIFAPLM